MKDALKSIPGLADVGVPHRDGDGPRTPSPGSQMSGGSEKKFQISNLTTQQYFIYEVLARSDKKSNATFSPTNYF